MRLLLTLISRVPFAALYFVATAFYLLNRYVVRYRYDVARANLRNAFPERPENAIDALTEQTFRNLADLLVEIVKGSDISREELDCRITFSGTDRVHELVDQGQPLIFLATHHCNWEWWLLHSCNQMPHPPFAAYKPFHIQQFDEFMLKARTRFGATAFPATDLIRQIYLHRKEMKTLALLIDQSPAGKERKYWTKFLNQDTAFIDGIDNLAWLTKMPVVFVRTRRTKRGHYDIWFKEIAEPPFEKNSHVIIERYARELEATIEADPASWLWTHRRWKLNRSDDED